MMSSETFFTKREWEIVTEKDSEHYCLTVDCGGVMRLNVITSARDITFSESLERIANAHLIAAAPEMYALINDLRHAVSMGGIGGGINNNEVLNSMDTLLAKARGEV